MSERLTAFLKTVEDFADAECEELRSKAQSFKDDSINAYRKEAENKSRALCQYETNRISSRTGGEISAYEVEKKAALTRLRSEINEKVFNEVSEKINEFTKSPAYADFLKKSAAEIRAALGNDAVFYLRPADMKYADIFANGAPVHEDGEIILGGIRATDNSGSIRADDTLDARLAAQRTEFSEKSELKFY